jgi:hypothetical protein
MPDQYIDVNIKKPLYANFVRIRDKYIYQAIKEKKKLRITIPQGTGIHDPQEWMKTGKRVEQVFLMPDNPMILWGNYVKITPAQKEENTTQVIVSGYTNEGISKLLSAWNKVKTG